MDIEVLLVAVFQNLNQKFDLLVGLLLADSFLFIQLLDQRLLICKDEKKGQRGFVLQSLKELL